MNEALMQTRLWCDTCGHHAADHEDELGCQTTVSLHSEEPCGCEEFKQRRFIIAFDGRFHVRETLFVHHDGGSGERTVKYETKVIASGENMAEVALIIRKRYDIDIFAGVSEAAAPQNLPGGMNTP